MRARLLLAPAAMTIRTFAGTDGTVWTAWFVQSTGMAPVSGAPPEWLVFQNGDGSERRRLLEVPDGWEELADERLDLLRRVAEPVKGWIERHTPPGGTGQRDGVDSE